MIMSSVYPWIFSAGIVIFSIILLVIHVFVTPLVVPVTSNTEAQEQEAKPINATMLFINGASQEKLTILSSQSIQEFADKNNISLTSTNFIHTHIYKHGFYASEKLRFIIIEPTYIVNDGDFITVSIHDHSYLMPNET